MSTINSSSSLLSDLNSQIISSIFDIYSYTNTNCSSFQSLLSNQLGLTSLTITVPQDSFLSTSLTTTNGSVTAYYISGTLTTSGDILGSTESNLGSGYIYFWWDTTNSVVQTMLGFGLDSTNTWGFTTAYPSLGDDSNPNYSSIFSNLVSTDVLVVLTSTDVNDFNFSGLGSSYSSYTSESVVATDTNGKSCINILFKASTLSTISNIYPALGTIATLTGVELPSTSFQFNGTIDNSDNTNPIIQVNTGIGQISSLPFSNALNNIDTEIGFLTSLYTSTNDDGSKTSFLNTDIALYITLPTFGTQTTGIQFQSLLSIISPSVISVSMVDGEEIKFSDLTSIFSNFTTSALKELLPSSIQSAISNIDDFESYIDITAFGFSFSVSSPAILSFNITFNVSLTSPYVLIADILAFNSLTFSLFVNTPISSPTYNIMLSGTLGFLETTTANMSFRAQYDSSTTLLSIGGGLLEGGTTMDLSTLSSTFNYDTSDFSFLPTDTSSTEIALGFSFSYYFTESNVPAGSVQTSYGISLLATASSGTWQIGDSGPSITQLTISANKGESTSASMSLTIGTSNFSCIISGTYDSGVWTLSGDLSSTSTSSQSLLTDILQAFDSNLSLPSGFSSALDITDIAINYQSGNTATPTYAQVAIGIEDKAYGKMFFASSNTASDGWMSGFILEFDNKIDFGKLPLIGKVIDAYGGFAISPVELIVIPQNITAADKVTFLSVSSSRVTYPTLPDASQGIKEELTLNLTATIGSDTETLTINIPVESNAQGGEGGQGGDGNDEGASSSASSGGSQTVGKTFGPVSLQKYSVDYVNQALDIDVTGSLSMAGIAFGLEGLNIGIPFPFDSDASFTFALQGLAVDIQEDAFSISGGFVNINDDYVGALTVQAGEFGIQAYGGYSNKTGDTSFFILANINYPIGGPPYFFVDGVSGGFGINRAFKLPSTIKELATYPMMPGNNIIPQKIDLEQDGFSQLTTALEQLATYIYPENGNYWVAAGLDVTSFEMIQVNALLSVSFGVNLEVALLGSANMTLPISEDPDPLAYIAIDFIIAVEPNKGIFTAMGTLTPASYIYSGLAHISGGFAFDIWFAGAHEGDFVVSIGGYNPQYKKPSNYPTVPRLEISWGLGPFYLDGQAYFALTPKMMMAGMGITGGWHGGPVNLTFSLGIDFLIDWKPFMYEADAYFNLDISVHLLFHFHFNIGANITIWGPSFGGRAHIHLSVISFTIGFGSDGPSAPPLTWKEFVQLLPNTYPNASSSQWALSTIETSAGLRQQNSAYQSPIANTASNLRNDEIYNWIIDANHFEFDIVSKVPITSYQINNETAVTQDGINNPNLGIAPMNIHSSDGFTSNLTVQIKSIGANGTLTDPADIDDINTSVQCIRKSVSAALWGSTGSGSTGLDGNNRTISNVLVGLKIVPPVWSPASTNSISIQNLLFDGDPITTALAPVTANTSNPTGTTVDYSNTATSLTSGSGLIGELMTNDFQNLFSSSDVNISTLGDIVFEDTPTICTLGQEVSN